MDFNLTKEQELIRKALAEFTEEEVKPIAAETDRTEQYPADTYRSRRAVQAVRFHRRHRCYPQRPVLRTDHQLRYRGAEEEVSAAAG